MVGNEINKTNGAVDVETGHDLNLAEGADCNGKACGAGSPRERAGRGAPDEASDGPGGAPAVPDGGWGWMVVLAAFATSACADGLAYSFGVLHEEFTDYFAESQSKTSLVGSLFISLPLISGPVMSALVDRYGCRRTTMAAAVLAAAGFLLAALSDSVELLCLTLGVVSGLAMGVLYVTCVVSVAFWFERRRTLAVSLASCGIGFGTLVYSPLTDYLLELYDWRNTLVLLAGTVLNVCVCGALMRDPDWLVWERRQQRRERSPRSSGAGSTGAGGESTHLSAAELGELVRGGGSPERILATLTTSLAVAERLEAAAQLAAERRRASAVDLPTFLRQDERVPAEAGAGLECDRSLSGTLGQSPRAPSRRKSAAEAPPSAAKRASLKVTVLADKPKPKTGETHAHAESRVITQLAVSEHIPNGGILSEVKPRTKPEPPGGRRAVAASYARGASLLRTTMLPRAAPRGGLRAASLPDIYRNSAWSLSSDPDDEKRSAGGLGAALRAVCDVRLFAQLHFVLFNAASLIVSLWAIVPYFFLTSYMSELGVDGGALMLSIIGIASGVGIVLLGWAGDQPWLHVTKAYAACLCACALSVCAYPLARTPAALAGVSALFGLGYAGSYAYTPAILMQLVPLERFTAGYGFILLSQGLGHLIGPPLGGLLYDVSGSWELTFYAGGAWLALAAACVAAIPCTDNVRLCARAPTRPCDVACASEKRV